MTRWAVMNIHSRPVEIDEDRTYALTDGGERFKAHPMSNGDELAIFDTLEAALTWIDDRKAAFNR